MTNETRFGQWFNGLHLANNGLDEKDDLSADERDMITEKFNTVKHESEEDSDEAFAKEEGEDVFPVDENGRHKLIRKSSLFEDDGHKILEELVHGIPMKQKDKFVKVVKKFLRYFYLSNYDESFWQ